MRSRGLPDAAGVRRRRSHRRGAARRGPTSRLASPAGDGSTLAGADRARRFERRRDVLHLVRPRRARGLGGGAGGRRLSLSAGGRLRGGARAEAGAGEVAAAIRERRLDAGLCSTRRAPPPFGPGSSRGRARPSAGRPCSPPASARRWPRRWRACPSAASGSPTRATKRPCCVALKGEGEGGTRSSHGGSRRGTGPSRGHALRRRRRRGLLPKVEGGAARWRAGGVAAAPDRRGPIDPERGLGRARDLRDGRVRGVARGTAGRGAGPAALWARALTPEGST